jgi:PadR family transcriptional regulator PadR
MSVKDRVLNQNELIVMLAIQRRRRDAYGVSIRDEIEKRTSRKMTFGVLYTILNRLEQDGLLTSRDGEATPERGGRAKKYFAITGKGQRAVNVSLSDLRALQPTALGGAAHA